MKNLVHTLLLGLVINSFLLGSCSKSDSDSRPGPMPAPIQIDTSLTRIKQIVITALPSPYYHFTYNDSGYATHIEFASGLYRYDLSYQNRRISRVTNSINGDWLNYFYHHGLVVAIEEFSGISGKIRMRYEFTYDLNERLVHVDWYSFPSAGNTKLLEKSADLKYNNKGNLVEYKYSLRMDDGSIKWANTTTYEGYDNKQNVDDFGILKEFFEHLLFLPAVKFMKNNPASIRINSINNEFEVNYQFQYEQDRPIKKVTRIRQVRGDNVGREITSSTQYTYY